MLLWIPWILFEPELWTSHKHSVESFWKIYDIFAVLNLNWNITRQQNGYI